MRMNRVLAATVLLMSSSAFATTVPYTTALVSTFNPVESVTSVDQHSAPAASSSISYAQSGAWGSVGGFASSNLSTGQLKIRAANLPQSGTSPYMQSNAWFGDGFRASTPSGPFTWSPTTNARFAVDLTGNQVSSSGPIDSLGFGQVGGFVLFSYYQPGTLDPTTKIVGGANNLGYFLYTLGNPNENLTYTDQQGQSHPLVPTANYNLDADIHIAQNFQPGSDFDWVMLLGAAGQVNGPEFYDIDLSHTLTMNYSGPAGTTTIASSGLFNNFTPIPEPSSIVMLGVGMIALVRRVRA